MAIEIRPCRDDAEMKALDGVASYVFANNQPDDPDRPQVLIPDWTMAAFDDGKLVTSFGSYPFRVRLNGRPVPMGGVTAVGTLPTHRRRGFLRKVMTAGHERMKEENQPFAILWASMAAIYQRFGYGVGSVQVRYRVDPRQAAFAFDEPLRGAVEFVRTDEAMAITKPLYVEYSAPRNLNLHRAPVMWEQQVFRPENKGEPVYTAVYRDDTGVPRGYVVYQTRDIERQEIGPSQRLTIRDWVALDADAYRGLWEFLRSHDLVFEIDARAPFGDDDPVPNLLLEPRQLNRATKDGVWMRVVDVQAGLPLRPYGSRGELTFEVAGDSMCPWNNGTYLLETDGAATEVSRTARSAELSMRPNSLASLVAGQSTATKLHRAGLIEVAEPSALARADALFRTEFAPHCPDEF
jgi:predicted acetyltransferase